MMLESSECVALLMAQSVLHGRLGHDFLRFGSGDPVLVEWSTQWYRLVTRQVSYAGEVPCCVLSCGHSDIAIMLMGCLDDLLSCACCPQPNAAPRRVLLAQSSVC